MRKKLGLTPTLTTVIGAFVLVTSSLVLAVQAITSKEVVENLGSTLVVSSMRALEGDFYAYLQSIETQARFAAKAYANGTILAHREEEASTFMYGALAATPEARFMLFRAANGRTLHADRDGGDEVFVPKRGDMGTPESLASMREAALTHPDGFWSEVEYIPARLYSYVAFIVPVVDGDTFLGVIMVGLSLNELSHITEELSQGPLKVFLMLGQDQLLAHPSLDRRSDLLRHDHPLLKLEEAPDAFLANYAQYETFDSEGLLPEKMEVRFGTSKKGKTRIIVVDNTQTQFGGKTVRLGAHFSNSLLRQPLDQLTNAILIGIALLGLALVGAGLLSHYIAAPIRRAASGARSVAMLDLHKAPRLPGSPVRELDDLANGFNTMVGGLSAFLRYMPRALVKKLMSEGLHEAPPELRDLAVLFTDIVGYTNLSEGMGATETAHLVNHHLTLVGNEIHRHGGTIDKYIGDSVMAFWGAPEPLDNPALPAALAALDIARAIQRDNTERVSRGQPPVRIRIGVHMGPLVVGDIGAPERVNYTVIGDTVNAASRLENLGREIDPDAEVCLLVSDEVAFDLPQSIRQEPLGPRQVPGRREPLNVVRLFPKSA